MTLRNWPAAAQLASLAIKGFPSTKRGMALYLTRIGAAAVEERAGGGLIHRFNPKTLPRPLALAWGQKLLGETAPEPVDIAASAVVPRLLDTMREHQRRCMEARLALLAELERIAESSGLNQAIAALVELARTAALPAHLQGLVPVANARAGESGKRHLSRRSLLRWRKERSRCAVALAPRDGREALPPAWGAALLAAFARPQKPSLAAALAALKLPPGITAPSYHQARRLLAKVSVIAKRRGRMGPRALKTLRSFTRRDVAGLMPLDVVLMDGHTFDAEVAHPVHGQPFRPEITSIIDARTRSVIGWSVALAESQHAVMDAIRRAAVTRGVSALLYVDRGSGYEGQILAAPGLGLLARLGTRHETSLPYNSQARGMIERLHRSLWVAAAKELPTFIGADMDAEAKKAVFKLTRKALAARAALMPWDAFLAFVAEHVAAYNARPHRSLDGKSPDEAWAAALAAGWTPLMVSDAEAADLFRPAREAVTRRGEVVLFGNRYFNQALEHRTGERVQLAYDIHDATKVWVKDLEGRLLCEAVLDGNKRDFFPKAVVEQAREQRARARERRLQLHLAEVRAELGPRVIEGEAQPLDPALQQLADEQWAKLAPPANDPAPPEVDENGRPIFRTDKDFGLWCLAHPELMTDYDRRYFEELCRSWTFRFLIGIEKGEGIGA